MFSKTFQDLHSPTASMLSFSLRPIQIERQHSDGAMRQDKRLASLHFPFKACRVSVAQCCNQDGNGTTGMENVWAGVPGSDQAMQCSQYGCCKCSGLRKKHQCLLPQHSSNQSPVSCTDCSFSTDNNRNEISRLETAAELICPKCFHLFLQCDSQL